MFLCDLSCDSEPNPAMHELETIETLCTFFLHPILILPPSHWITVSHSHLFHRWLVGKLSATSQLKSTAHVVKSKLYG